VLDLANAAERRRDLRFELRERMRSSVADVKQHARELGDAIRESWQSWCARPSLGQDLDADERG
jgi:hypothetical protein